MSGKGTPATLLLAREQVPHTVLTYELPTGADTYGEGVAAALGVEPERMLKTLVAEVDGRLRNGVVPVAGQLDLKALAHALGGKHAALAPAPAAERATGYVVGGISPLGQRTALQTAVDETVELFDTVVVSAGRRGLSVELAPADLVRLTSAVVAPIGKDPR